MMRFRYRLSWLLLVPVLLALMLLASIMIQKYRPPLPASYAHLTKNKPWLLKASSIYHVKQEYLDRKSLLDEIRGCDYAIVFLGAGYSPNTKVMVEQLHDLSEFYQGRVPVFIGDFYEDEFLDWFPGTTVNYRYSDSYVLIVQRGVIIHQVHDYQTTSEIHSLLKRILPWNYKL